MKKVICAAESNINVELINVFIEKYCSTYQKSKHIFRLFTKYHKNKAPNSELIRKQEIIRIPSESDTFIC